MAQVLGTLVEALSVSSVSHQRPPVSQVRSQGTDRNLTSAEEPPFQEEPTSKRTCSVVPGVSSLKTPRYRGSLTKMRRSFHCSKSLSILLTTFQFHNQRPSPNQFHHKYDLKLLNLRLLIDLTSVRGLAPLEAVKSLKRLLSQESQSPSLPLRMSRQLHLTSISKMQGLVRRLLGSQSPKRSQKPLLTARRR